MRRLGTLLALAGVLATVIAWEIIDRPHADVAGRSAHAVAARQPAPSAHVTHVHTWVATVLGRPLFSPDRRPAAQEDAAATGMPGLPRLTGIMVGPFGRRAIFDRSGGKPIVVDEGGRIDAYTVASIGVAQVQLRGPNGLHRLQPTFDTADQASAASPALTRRAGQVTVQR